MFINERIELRSRMVIVFPSAFSAILRSGFDRRLGHIELFEKSVIRIYLSYIFLLTIPEQNNVGQINTHGSVLKSSADGRNDDQSYFKEGIMAPISGLQIVS